MRLFVSLAVALAAFAADAVTLTQANLAEVRARMQTRSRDPIDLDINEPITLSQNETWIVDDVNIGPRGIIFLREYSLDITLDELKLTSSGVVFASFPPSESKAPDGGAGANGGASGGSGSAGQPGANGKNAGDLTLRIADKAVGTIVVMLNGQSGGNGGRGGNGAAGRPGTDGKPGTPGVFNCVKPAIAGTAGTPGGNGGNGGAAGACGQGGTLRILYGRTLPRFELRNAAPARPGSRGQGGAAGPGGRGGGAVPGVSFCTGLPAAIPGASGAGGRAGAAASGTCQPPRAEPPLRRLLVGAAGR